MYEFYIFIISFLLSITCVYASELTGRISTNPQALTEDYSQTNISNSSANSSANNSNFTSQTKTATSTSQIKAKQNFSTGKTITGNQLKQAGSAVAQGQVLGAKYYYSGALLRNGQKQVYLTEGERKKLVSPAEMAEFSGHHIYDVGEAVLKQYQEVKYLSNDLVRKKGDRKIYVIKHGKRIPIVNLEILRKRFKNARVWEITAEEADKFD